MPRAAETMLRDRIRISRQRQAAQPAGCPSPEHLRRAVMLNRESGEQNADYRHAQECSGCQTQVAIIRSSFAPF